MSFPPADALLVIDMQMEMQRRLAAGRDCANPEAPQRIAALLALYRAHGWPVIHIRHGDRNPASPFYPGAPGHAPMRCALERPGEAVFEKTTSSAFASTDLEGHLTGEGLRRVAVVGAVAGFCVSSTVRQGADLGFEMVVVRDAVLDFDLPAAGLSARQSCAVTLALLEADFARLVDSAAILEAAAGSA